MAGTTAMDNVESGEVAAPYPVTAGDTKPVATAEKDVVAKEGDDEGKDDKKEKAKSVGTAKLLFKYATPLEILYMFLGTCAAVVCG